MSSDAPYGPVINQLNAGATVITATRRLARELQIHHARLMGATGQTVWVSPDVLPWQAWLRRFWHDNLGQDPLPRLLSEPQVRAWWEQAVQHRPSPLMQSSGAARTAYQAWRLLADYEVPLAKLQGPHALDSQSFSVWANDYAECCRDNDWLDPAYLLKELTSRVQARTLEGKCLVFAGFDEFSPAQQRFLTSLRKAGAVIETWLPRLKTTSIERLCQPDGSTELLNVARYCRQILLNKLQATVGVVVPDLSQQRSHVEQVFSAVLAPLHPLKPDEDRMLPFHLSLGRPLTNYNLIQSAVWTLKLVQGELQYGELLAWLRSPFIGGAVLDRQTRATLELAIRGSGRFSWRLGSLQNLIEDTGLPGFERFTTAVVLQQQASTHKSHAQWAHWCSEVLAVFAWPGEIPMTEQDRQLLRRWLSLLDQIVSRDLVVSKVSCQDFLSALRRAAGETLYEPRSTGAPVQVLGVLEAAGLYFDFLWVTGLTDDAWPRKVYANPFLSTEVRSTYKLPGGSPSRDLERARELSERVLASARQVIVSYPERLQDEPLRPSPLLGDFREVTVESLQLGSAITFVEQVMQASAIEVIDDHGSPVISANVGGGSGLLKAQSACPFRGFAQFRLHARPTDIPSVGFDPRQRGIFVHEVLQRIWERLQDQNTLAGLTSEALDFIVGEAAEASLAKYLGDSDESMRRLAELEQHRIAVLVTQQLELEKQRPPFLVEATEKQQRIKLGCLDLNVRIDRVDRNGDDVFLVDYKTGNADVNQWLGERPEEPQMPLYTRLYPKELVGLVYAKLKAGEIGFSGVSEEAGQFPGVKSLVQQRKKMSTESWPQLLHQWHDTTDALAEDFVRGVAHVDPLKNACDYCHLSGLCRVAELDGESQG